MTVSLYEHMSTVTDDAMETMNEQGQVERFILKTESVSSGIDWRLIRDMGERWQSDTQVVRE